MNEIRVALIEDHELTRMGLATVLQQNDRVKVIGSASNGIDGLKLLTTSKPDVAIIDIGLPDIDGIELTRRFKQFLTESEDAEVTQTKVMVLTMQDNEDAVLAAFAAGADSYCMKEANADKLLMALQTTHEGNNWIDPAIARIVLQETGRVQIVKDSPAVSSSNTVEIMANSEYSQIIESFPLTKRQLEILSLIVAGHSNAEISSQCYITIGTVKAHVRSILNKLCVDDRTQAAVRALRSGLVA